jgi:hypothetical protein
LLILLLGNSLRLQYNLARALGALCRQQLRQGVSLPLALRESASYKEFKNEVNSVFYFLSLLINYFTNIRVAGAKKFKFLDRRPGRAL